MDYEQTSGETDAAFALRSRAAPIIERAPLPIVEAQGKFHIVTYVNSAFCRLLGKTREELIGKPFAVIVSNGPKCVPILDQVYNTGEAATLAQPDDSEPAYWLYAMWPALDANDKPVGVIIQLAKTNKFPQSTPAAAITAAGLGKSANLDQTVAEINEALLISGLRQHELTEEAEKLNAQLQKEIAERKSAQAAKFLLASIVEGSDDSIISIDFDLKITSWNRGAEQLYGYSAEEAIGQSINMLTLPEDLKKALSRIDRIKHGEKVETFEIERVKKGGRHLNVSVTLSAIRDETGEPIGISTVSRDITEQKKLENELRTAKGQLEHRADHLEKMVAERTASLVKSVKSLENLNYTMAHDLRAPLRAMRAFAMALLEDVPLDETGKNYAERISTAAERMDQLVNDLLEYGELSHLEFPVHPVDLKSQIEKVLSELAKETQAANAEIQVQEPLPIVSGNKTLVGQILSNLLSNALKFVAPGVKPRILIRAETRDSMTRLWVEDNGIGIAPQHENKIFGIFQRLHTTEEFPGTGVGLAIVQRAVERMGGQAGMESESGTGSKFWVELPNAKASD